MESMIEFNISPSAVSNSNGCLLLIISRTTAGYIYFGSQSYQLTDYKITIANNTGRIIGGGAIECLHLKGFMVALTGQADSNRLKSSELEIYIVELKASSEETLTPTVQFLCP